MEIIYGERSVKIGIDKREYIRVSLGNDLCVDLVEHTLCSNNVSKIYVDRDVRIRKRKPVTGPFMDLFNNRFAIIACSKDPSCSYAALLGGNSPESINAKERPPLTMIPVT